MPLQELVAGVARGVRSEASQGTAMEEGRARSVGQDPKMHCLALGGELGADWPFGSSFFCSSFFGKRLKSSRSKASHVTAPALEADCSDGVDEELGDPLRVLASDGFASFTSKMMPSGIAGNSISGALAMKSSKQTMS